MHLHEPMPSRNRLRCSAFTLVEMLVTIAIIGIFIGILTPGIQAMRETARRSACQSRLMGIGIAIQSYHSRWQHFPVGTIADAGPIISVAKADTATRHHNWIGRLVGLMDQPVVASNINRSASVYDTVNEPVLSLNLPNVKCPSATSHPINGSNYVGLHHPTEKQIDKMDHGAFVLNVPITRDDVTDGLSNTIFVSEKITRAGDLGWLSGTRATLRNVGGGIEKTLQAAGPGGPKVVGSIGSLHPAGVHAMFGNGEIRFLSNQIDQRVLEQMVDRRDGQLPLHFKSIDQLRRESVGLPNASPVAADSAKESAKP